VINFTRAGGRVGHHGITVNAICPGFFRTKMAEVLIDQLGEDKMKAGARWAAWATTRT
jgi:gluconate 5-dehydrogenase